MPLDRDRLKLELERGWLGGGFPASSLASADRFSAAIVAWFANATAAGLPCSTALLRRPQLTASARLAFEAGDAHASGALLGTAVALYLTGQLFGTGAAAAPVGAAGAALGFAAILGDLNASASARASRLAVTCTTLSSSVIVLFPNAPYSAPVS